VVFRLPGHKRTGLGSLEAKWGNRFASRHAWGRKVAYRSQFNDPTGRAHAGKKRIKNKLISGPEAEEWDFPPKPKWMRWATYERHERQFYNYEGVLNRGVEALLVKWVGKI
jgi:hypothetical protein